MKHLNNDNSLVFWLDMLGYKVWLSTISNNEIAEDILLNNIKFAFNEIDDGKFYISNRNILAPIPMSPEKEKFDSFEITSLLISDTIILSTPILNLEAFEALYNIYETLAARLSSIGLPLRGAISIGSYRFRKTNPMSILGNSIVSCATLEPTINAFAVAIDDSFLEHFISTIQSFFPFFEKSIWANKDNVERLVLKFRSVQIPYGILMAWTNLKKSHKTNPNKHHKSIVAFSSKLVNSHSLFSFETAKIQIDDNYAKTLWHSWTTACEQAEEFLQDVKND